MKAFLAMPALFVLAGALPALAQRASENAVTAASDAFGTTVGNETIGLYSANDARGFSPVQAGNVRINGLYFDQRASLSQHLVRGSTMRVGLSAQSYAFPAPTGIADYTLRLPGEKPIVSTVTGYGNYDKYFFEVDSQFPIVADQLSVGVGGEYTRDDTPWAARNDNWEMAGIARWRPADGVEIIPFAALALSGDQPVKPFLRAAGANVVPRIPRHQFFGQDWAANRNANNNAGLVANVTAWEDWTLRAGLFRSETNNEKSYLDYFRNIQPNGLADHFILEGVPKDSVSYSGELRAARVFKEGDRRHTIQGAIRAREVDRESGGDTTLNVGTAFIGIADPIPKPVFTHGGLQRDHVSQQTAGISYEGLWNKVGEMSVGVQKTMYARTVTPPTGPIKKSKDLPLLYNGTLAIYATDQLAFYASYTRGMEESGTAPNSAVNGGEALPASLTTQYDAGIRYAFTPNLSLVAGVFEVQKPYFNLNTANVYTNLGDVTHRGIELSLAGRLAEGLTVVAGTVLIESRVEAPLVTSGVVGKTPVNVYPRVSRLNVQYGPQSWNGLSVDGQIESLSSVMADLANTVKLPRRTTVNLGARYRFELYNSPAVLRFQVSNVLDQYGWDVSNTAWLYPSEPRRFLTQLTVDF